MSLSMCVYGKASDGAGFVGTQLVVLLFELKEYFCQIWTRPFLL